MYFYFVETNGYKLEVLDEIFADAHHKHENPVFTEKKVRKGEAPDVEQRVSKLEQSKDSGEEQEKKEYAGTGNTGTTRIDAVDSRASS